jgi:hypothetical protein
MHLRLTNVSSGLLALEMCYQFCLRKPQSLEISMRLKTIAIGLNILLLMLRASFFIGHGLPKSLMLWSSAILWFVAPMVNLLYVKKNPKIAFTNIANGFDL